jgi:cytochrome d ubiquinol oxidase subunit I
MAFSAWHLLRKHDVTFFRPSFRMAAIYALIGSILVGLVGHAQGQFMTKVQPMKMAAAEAHYHTEDPAALSLITITNLDETEEIFSFRIPFMLSLMSYNRPSGEVKGINDLQDELTQSYGPGDYVPPVNLNFWSFRAMVGAGGLMVVLSILGVLWSKDRSLDTRTWYLKAMMFAAGLPYLASTTGWILAETGRWPWIVYGLQKVEDAVSPNVPAWNVIFSLGVMTILYTALTIIAFRLAIKYGTSDVRIKDTTPAEHEATD